MKRRNPLDPALDAEIAALSEIAKPTILEIADRERAAQHRVAG
jgi:hypothetical protein